MLLFHNFYELMNMGLWYWFLSQKKYFVNSFDDMWLY